VVSRAFFATEKMDTPISTFDFKRMALMLSLRDLFSGPRETLAEVDIQPGFQVLDYGCGTESFTFEAAQRVGPEGKVYALDIHPLALEKVQKGALKKGLANIETVLASCITHLAHRPQCLLGLVTSQTPKFLHFSTRQCCCRHIFHSQFISPCSWGWFFIEHRARASVSS
jgi:predicted methyltransferase